LERVYLEFGFSSEYNKKDLLYFLLYFRCKFVIHYNISVLYIMGTMLQLGLLIIAIIAFINITSLVMSFLGIGIESYANYLIWVVALMIFYIVLPKKKEA